MSFAPTTLIEQDTRLTTLLEMLTYMRPANSQAEVEFINKFLMPLPGAQVDGFGNIWLDVGAAEPNIIWSSHTDTVHHDSGRQKLAFKDSMVCADVQRRKLNSQELDALMKDYMRTSKMPHVPKDKKTTNCLGADCTSGIWLMIEMIKAGQPGRYIFHREEETGGHGSSHIARNESHLLKGIEFCVALDRKGYYDVITHQMVGRTASNAFAASMADILGGNFKACDGGTFTDSANYADIVPECTNLSIGYFHQHGPGEYQDLEFILWMRDKLCSADFSTLVVDRDPKAKPSRYSMWDDEEDDGSYIPRKKGKLAKASYQEWDALYDIIVENPDAMTDWLSSQHFTAEDLANSLDLDNR